MINLVQKRLYLIYKYMKGKTMRGRIFGLIITLFAIVAAIKLEGGQLASILCATSLILVLGGVVGTLMTVFSLREIFTALKYLFLIKVAEEERQKCIDIFEHAGKYSLAFGFIGFIIGTIYILANLTSISLLGRHLAAALTSVLYGVVFAYMIFFPMAVNLKNKNNYLV